jgi:hypothetical protein
MNLAASFGECEHLRRTMHGMTQQLSVLAALILRSATYADEVTADDQSVDGRAQLGSKSEQRGFALVTRGAVIL